MELIIDCILDALKDGAMSIPILYLAYLLMEYLEHSEKLNESVLNSFSHKAGPAIGGLLGAVPQCGISGASATLFSTGSITVGTMLAVFFATSDEMLPIMLSSLADKSIKAGSILLIVASKAVLGILLGYIVDAIWGKKFRASKSGHNFCEGEHCECEEKENAFLAALIHTIKIALMLIAVNFVLNIVFSLIGVERLTSTVLRTPFVGELILALFGLIPNCSISVIITESYLAGIFGIGGLFAGLLANGGIGLLVLFRTNKSVRENITVVAILWGLSVVAGTVIDLVSRIF